MFYYIFINKNVHVFGVFSVFSLEKTSNKTKKNNYNIKKTKNVHVSTIPLSA